MKRLRFFLAVLALPVVLAGCPDDEGYGYEYRDEEVDSSIMGPSISLPIPGYADVEITVG